ncbi:hypothetical protein AURDEDRAFT_174691 [Auricularia subglabra TFB-10046 SS5]|nr:hypothetical protein AURDEDRAFT_174691 [Auricularia subglabra TFB-10046 SS5]
MSTLEPAAAIALVDWNTTSPTGVFFAQAERLTPKERSGLTRVFSADWLETSAHDASREFVDARLAVHGLELELKTDLGIVLKDEQALHAVEKLLTAAPASSDDLNVMDVAPPPTAARVEMMGALAQATESSSACFSKFVTAAMHLCAALPPAPTPERAGADATPVPPSPPTSANELLPLLAVTSASPLVDGEFPDIALRGTTRPHEADDGESQARSAQPRRAEGRKAECCEQRPARSGC